ncbi:MAG: pitrilysin family protein [Bacilli bacterium]|nr:pitrilysin family protein [Bacilli bacterium]
MKKIELKDIAETLYYEKLNNGLEIYMVPKKNVNNVYVTYTTKYGSIHNQFVPLNEAKEVKVPNGIAHFLEHKMFEQRDGIDPMIYYASVGADVNAFTSYKNTSYLFCGSTHLKENLEYLLNYVGTPHFTDENVEKEKGIIEQEIRMYDDVYEWVLIDTIHYNAFHKHPLKYSVAGTVDDIMSITKEQLSLCYNTFYHPSNMFLVVTGNFEPLEIIETVKKEFASKEQSEALIKLVSVEEPNSIVKAMEIIQLDIKEPKLGIGVKIPIENIDMDIHKLNIYVMLLFDLLFGPTSVFYEKMHENDLLTSPMFITKEFTNQHIVVSLLCETKNNEQLLNEIKDNLNNPKINYQDFERKKKILTGPEIRMYEDIQNLNRYIINQIISYGKFDHNMIKSLLKSLNKKEFIDLIKKLDLSQMVTVLIEPIKK